MFFFLGSWVVFSRLSVYWFSNGLDRWFWVVFFFFFVRWFLGVGPLVWRFWVFDEENSIQDHPICRWIFFVQKVPQYQKECCNQSMTSSEKKKKINIFSPRFSVLMLFVRLLFHMKVYRIFGSAYIGALRVLYCGWFQHGFFQCMRILSFQLNGCVFCCLKPLQNLGRPSTRVGRLDREKNFTCRANSPARDCWPTKNHYDYPPLSLTILQSQAVTKVPCFLEALKYLKASKTHPFIFLKAVTYLPLPSLQTFLNH